MPFAARVRFLDKVCRYWGRAGTGTCPYGSRRKGKIGVGMAPLLRNILVSALTAFGAVAFGWLVVFRLVSKLANRGP